MNEDCTYALTVRALQQLPQHLLGVVFGAAAPSPENSFLQPSGLVGPGHLMSMLTRRHMHLYGTQPEALKEIVQATRANTRNRPKRSEAHTSELQSLMRISYAVFCLNKKNFLCFNFLFFIYISP